MPLQDIHNLERLRVTAKKDDIPPEGKTADVGTQFRPRAAKCSGQRGEFSALLLELVNEGAADPAIAAFDRDIS